jgi:hypothetical protein
MSPIMSLVEKCQLKACAVSFGTAQASFDANVPPSPAGLVASAAVPAGVAQRQ